MKIQKLKIFVLLKPEILEEIGNFLPLNMENKIFSIPFKTRSFEGNRKNLR